MFELSRNSISIFGFSIHFYGILIALGALMGVLLAMRREKRLGFPKDTTLDLALVCIPVAIVCARLYYVAFEWDYYKNNLLSIFNFRRGGLAIYGGVIGGLLSGFFVARHKKLSFLALADLAAPSISLGQAIGRWGNFFNQEAYGVAITNPAHKFFPMGVYIESDGLWHYATFFYESMWCLLIVAALLIAEKKKWLARRGDGLLWYCFLYALERAAVEGLRTDSLWLGNMRVSQALSLVLIVGVAVIFALRAGAPLYLRLAAPLLCAAVFILVGMGVVGSVSAVAFALYFASLAATAALYLKTARRAQTA